MITATKPNVTKEINALKREVKNLRSFVIGITGKDKEGVYRPNLVKEILSASAEKPDKVFKNAQHFLKEIENV